MEQSYNVESDRKIQMSSAEHGEIHLEFLGNRETENMELT
jgi:hypothetical protein